MSRAPPVDPQALVEHALATSTADGCVAIVRDAPAPTCAGPTTPSPPTA